MIAEASNAGSWAAAVGMPSLGVGAAAEMGVAVDRMLLVKTPAMQLWPTVVAALIDAFDFVLIDWPEASSSYARRLANRARERRSTILSIASGASSWREVADLCFSVTESHWQGLERGHGRLSSRLATVEMGGRRSVRPRQVTLWLPGPSGQVEVAVTEAFQQLPVVVSNAG